MTHEGSGETSLLSGIPASVYLLFHNKSEEGKYLARSIFRWLQLREQDDDGTGVGVPVNYRTDLCTSLRDMPLTKDSGLKVFSPEVRKDTQHLFLVPLVDDLMVADPDWGRALAHLSQWHNMLWEDEPKQKRKALELKANKPTSNVFGAVWHPSGFYVTILPVMVRASFASLSFLNNNYNPLRIWSSTDVTPQKPPEEPNIPNGADPLAAQHIRSEHDKNVKQYEKSKKAWWDVRARRLRRALTEQMIRDLDEVESKRNADKRWSALSENVKKELANNQIDIHSNVPRRLKVFLSHAKKDGADIAELIRDGLASVSRLESWFDQNDLNAGRNADEPMEQAARDSSGGMIAVVTDAYPTRPWCWREANAARTPRLVEGFEGILFTTLPTVAVHDVNSGWSRVPPALTRVPRIGWPARPPEPELTHPSMPMGIELASRRALDEWKDLYRERVADIVDRLLLELLMNRISRRIMKHLAQKHPNVVFVDFVPDAWTLSVVSQELDRCLKNETQQKDAQPKQERWKTWHNHVLENGLKIVYPGYSLRQYERRSLLKSAHGIFGASVLAGANQGTAPAVAPDAPPTPENHNNGKAPSQANVRMVALESLDISPLKEHNLPKLPIIGFSAGGSDQDLLFEGTSSEQVDDLTIRVVRYLIQNQYRVAFGGKLQPSKTQGNLTQAIIDTARGWAHDESFSPNQAGTSTSYEDIQQRAPILNYVARGRDGALTDEVKAEHIATCQFIVVPEEPVKPTYSFLEKVDYLSVMRKRMAEEIQGRILLAGKRHNWSGKLPGIAEELMTSLQKKVPTLLISTYGGSASALGKWLEGDEKESAFPLTVENEIQERKKKWAQLSKEQEETNRQQWAELVLQSTTAFEELKQLLIEVRKDRTKKEDEAFKKLNLPNHLEEQICVFPSYNLWVIAPRSATRIIEYLREWLETFILPQEEETNSQDGKELEGNNAQV